MMLHDYNDIVIVDHDGALLHGRRADLEESSEVVMNCPTQFSPIPRMIIPIKAGIGYGSNGKPQYVNCQSMPQLHLRRCVPFPANMVDNWLCGDDSDDW